MDVVKNILGDKYETGKYKKLQKVKKARKEEMKELKEDLRMMY